MLHGQKVIVVLPAYRAERTLEQTYRDIPHDVVDEVLLVDDASPDGTARLSRELGIPTFVHEKNLGYGGNQKTCYREALGRGADIVVMLHPDYQYDPRLVTAMAAMIASGIYDVVLGSRILGNTARGGGMPLYKYVANRALTAIQNLLMGTKLSEFHTGYRAYRAGCCATCRCAPTPTTSCSTTRCWRRSRRRASRSARSRARRSTSPRPARSTSRGRSSTGWVSSGRASATGCGSGDLPGRGSSRGMWRCDSTLPEAFLRTRRDPFP